MAKKSGNSSGVNSLIKLAGYIALVVSAGITLITWILGLFDANLGDVIRIFDLIAKIALAIGVGLSAFYYTSGKSVFVKVLFWIAIAVFIVFNVLNLL